MLAGELAADVREEADVGAHVGGRAHRDDEDARGLAVEGVEVDAFRGERDGRDEARYGGGLRVGDCDAELHARGHLPLSLHEGREDGRAFSGGTAPSATSRSASSDMTSRFVWLLREGAKLLCSSRVLRDSIMVASGWESGGETPERIPRAGAVRKPQK